MAVPSKYQAKEVLNKVLNSGEDALNVDLADSVTVTVDSEFPAAAAITDNFANPTTTSAMSMLMGYDGSAWDRVTIGGGTEATALRVTIASDSTGVLSIDDNGGNISIDDGGNTITVDGTVSVSGLLADGHNVTIDNSSGGSAVNIQDGGNTITVDGTVDLGSTATTHLSEIEGAVETIETTVGTDGSAGPAKTLSVGGTESGGNIQELRVDSDGHLQIDVLSGGGGTEYSEDVATPGTITGLATMMERDDALGGLTPAEGDWASLRCDANGALWTHDDALDAAIDGNYINVNANIAGTDFVGGAGAVASGVQRVTLASDDPAVTSLGNLDNAVDGNYLNVNMNLAGSDAQAGEGTISATTQRVTIATDDDGVAHLATIAGAVSTEMQVDVVAALPAGDNNIGNVDIVSTPTTSATISGQSRSLTSYAALTGSNMTTDTHGIFSYVIQITGTDNCTLKVQGSNDNSNWVDDDMAEVTIATGASGLISGTTFFQYIRLQFKSSNTNGTTVNGQGYAK